MSDFAKRYGPTVLVTGASSGIGTAFAEEIAARGLDLVLAARRKDRLEALQKKLKADHGVNVLIIECDLARQQAAQELVAATANLDIGLVVSNAGFGAKGHFEEIDAQVMTDMLTVNCHSQMQLAHGFLPRLKARDQGGFLLVSSTEGLLGGPFSAAYAATKALAVTLGEGLWGECQGSGVDVLTLTPGATESEAAEKQGFDPSKMQNVQSARECDSLGLDNLASGPTFSPNAHYRAMFERLLAMPRKDALLAMAHGMRPKG